MMMQRNKEELLKMSDAGIPVVKCLARDTGPCVKRKMKQGKGASTSLANYPKELTSARGLQS
jgi:hypothetical protein